MEKLKNSSFIILVVVLLFIFLTGYWLYQATYYSKQARATTSFISVDNSFTSTNPLKALANANEKIRLTVYVLNDQGLGVSTKKTSLSANKDLIIDDVQSITDQYGKAIFDISSKTVGEFSIDVYADGKQLKNKATLNFY
jgi:cytoskeletal protein RodZ